MANLRHGDRGHFAETEKKGDVSKLDTLCLAEQCMCLGEREKTISRNI